MPISNWHVLNPVHKVNGIFIQATTQTIAHLCNLVINVQPNPIELVLLHYVSWSRYGGKVIQGILNGGTSLCLDSRQSFTRWRDQDQHRASPPLQRDRHGGGVARQSSTLTPATGSSSTSSPSLLTSGTPSPSAPRLRFVNSDFQNHWVGPGLFEQVQVLNFFSASCVFVASYNLSIADDGTPSRGPP